MVRIAGIDLPKNKRIEVALTYIYGIGRPSSARILQEAQIDPAKRTEGLSEEEVARIRKILDAGYRVEGDLRKEVSTNIKRLIELNAYRGIRHRKNLPVRGQRTHTNARTRKGPRRAVIGMKKKETPKG